MTLSDWFTSSENFRRNGKVIVEYLKQGLYAMPMTVGIKGDFAFNPATAWSVGSMPISYRQLRAVKKPDGSFSINATVIANYKSNAPEPMNIFWNRIQWRTVHGGKPRDALEIRVMQRLLIPLSANIFFKSGLQYLNF